MSTKKVALITGASSGIGRALAKELVTHNYRVFGTSRNPDKKHHIQGVDFLTLDITSDQSVKACVDEVIRQASHIDILINNAGLLFLGAAEETSIEEIRSLFETNYWGTIRMTKAVLPHMRAQGSGHIFNNTGLAGFIGTPYMSAYCASKFALEGYSEALDHEVRNYGVRVSVLEPGFVNTDLGNHRRNPTTEMALYSDKKKNFLTILQKQSLSGMRPEEVAREVVKIIERGKWRLRYPVGQGARLLSFFRKHLPSGMFDKRMRQGFKLG